MPAGRQAALEGTAPAGVTHQTPKLGGEHPVPRLSKALRAQDTLFQASASQAQRRQTCSSAPSGAVRLSDGAWQGERGAWEPSSPGRGETEPRGGFTAHTRAQHFLGCRLGVGCVTPVPSEPVATPGLSRVGEHQQGWVTVLTTTRGPCMNG